MSNQETNAEQAHVNHATAVFESIRKVIELMRRLAIDDYFFHIESIKQAETEDVKYEILSNLLASHKSAAEMDQALKSLLSAETHFRGTTVSLFHGYFQKAERQARESGGNLQSAVENISLFGKTAHKSKFFSNSLNELSGECESEKKIYFESKALAEVERFCSGIKNFSKSASEFANSVSCLPSHIKGKIHDEEFNLFDFIQSIGFIFMDEFKKLMKNSKKELSNSDVKIYSNSKDEINYPLLIINNYSFKFIDETEQEYNNIERGEKTISFLRALGKKPLIAINQEKTYAEVNSFYKKKYSSPRQALYTRLISEFILEFDPLKKNQYIKTMQILANQAEQSTTEKQNARSSLDYMDLKFFDCSGVDFSDIINFKSNNEMSIEIAMKILEQLNDNYLKNSLKNYDYQID